MTFQRRLIGKPVLSWQMPLSRDLQSRAAIVTKGILFGVLGAVSAGILLLEFFSWRHLALLAIAIWAFCRAS